MQRFDTRFLEVPDRLNNQLQRRFFEDVARTERGRVLMKNISMLVENTEYLLPDELMERVPDRLKKRMRKHREDEARHYEVWRNHLRSRGEVLEALAPEWQLPFDDFVAAGWLPSPGWVKEREAVEVPSLLRFFAMARVLEARVTLALSYFGEACRDKDEGVCALIEDILRDEEYHLAYLTEELELMAGEKYRDYAFYVKHKAWEVHSRWQMRSMGAMLERFLADPDFAGGGLRRRFWKGFRDLCMRAGATADPEELRALSFEEFDGSSLSARVQRTLLQLPEKLWGSQKGQPAADSGEVTVRVRVKGSAQAVFEAAAQVHVWHLWHANTWYASLRQQGPFRVGNSVVVRLRGGADLTEHIREWAPERQHAVLECRNGPFPLASYTSTMDVEAVGERVSELRYTMSYRLRAGALVDLLSKVGFDKALQKTLEADFLKFQTLFENPASLGNVFAPREPLAVAALA